MTYELVVFDVAGTTVRDDGAVANCLRETVARRGPAPPQAALIDVMGLAKPIALRELLTVALRRAPTREEIAHAHDEFERRMVRHYALDPEIEPIPGVSEAFAALRAQGTKVALDTGFSRRILNSLLERLGWSVGSTLDLTVASDEVARGRPYPDMIYRAMKTLGISNGRSVCKVGDTVADIREGRFAGAGLVVGVATGTCTRTELAHAGATLVLDSVADLPRVLSSRSAA